jgi:hypothetical protein
MNTQQTATADALGRAAFASKRDYYSLPIDQRAGWKAAATESADRARRERLTVKPELRDAWDKDPL